MNPPTLQTIGGYELRERIGAGGFGEVFRAYQPSVGREVAIKVILPRYANQPNFVRRFETEARLVARLEHPHIVPLYDYWREPDGAFLVMRYLRGGNLSDSLQQGPWTPEAAARLLDQVASGLAVAHRQEVVHRDIKPKNILLDEEGNAYLSDFGIAEELLRPTDVTGSGEMLGSPAYVSPEQARSEALTAQSDLYSLGVVMYQVLTGEHPFPSVTPVEQLFKHLTEPLPSVRKLQPDLPGALEEVIQRATAKDPAARFPDALSFAVAFRQALRVQAPVSGVAGEPLAEIPDQRGVAAAELLSERYRFERKIGSKGSFGEVWLATDTLLDRSVAIKCPKVAHDPVQRERFVIEARMLARLNHPNITQIHDALFDEDNDRFYLVMEYVDGQDLAEIIAGGTPLPLDIVLHIARGVLRALSYAHGQGIVHRDVKPDNVMIAGEVKLTDFGLANLKSILQSRTDFMAGTLAYIAPEQIEERAVDGRADLYSLGIMLFEMISGGHLPFDYASQVEMLNAHLHATPPPISQFAPTVPPVLEQAIVRLLAKDPEDRYPSADAVMEVLERLDRLDVETALAQAEDSPSPDRVVGSRLVDWEHEPDEMERPVFVARERELERLDEFLQMALAGQGQVIFVTGGPGRGKTALLGEFARRTMEAHPDLLVASGNCTAYSGVGDPYLPFREVMAMLTGNVAGAINYVHARRLWDGLPHAAQALVDHAPSLIGTVVPSAPLLSRAAAVVPPDAGWMQELRTFSEQGKAGTSGLEQSAIFEQITNVLRALAAQFPLLLLLDDLQWADGASIGLLFHLGRRLEGSRILVACAYRPEEVAIERDGTRHPLESVLSEFKRELGDVWVDLRQADKTEGRSFVDAFLDTEPNRLVEAFREELFRRAGGHPLFTIELLRAMQERGDVVQDPDGGWVETPALDWGRLPARVEAVVEARVGRLEEELRDMLAVASVEGERFTAQVVAQVQGISEREALRALSQELGTRHRLVRGGEEVQVGGRFLSRYQFAHALFQVYLHNGLSNGERRLLHGEIGMALEALYGDQAGEIAVQLAHHYAEAGQAEKAIEYSLRAGDQARLAYAHQEAIDHYQRALELLDREQEPARTADVLMRLAWGLQYAAQYRQALERLQQALLLYEQVNDPIRAADACFEIADRMTVHDLDEAFQYTLRGLEYVRDRSDAQHQVVIGYSNVSYFHRSRGNYEEAREALQYALNLAHETDDLDGLWQCYRSLSLLHYSRGEKQAALEAGAMTVRYAEQAGAPVQHRIIALNNQACFVQDVGDPEAAIETGKAGLALARRSGVVSEQVILAATLAGIYNHVGDWDMAEQVLNEGLRLLAQRPHPYHEVALYIEAGNIAYGRGDWEQAIEHWGRAEEKSRTGTQQVFTAELRARLARAWVQWGGGSAEFAEALEQAERWSSAARALAEEREQQGALAAGYRAQGMIERAWGNWEAGERAFERGLALARELDAPVEAARMLLEYGLLLAEAGRVEEGRTRLREAEEQATGIGLRPVAQAAREALRATTPA